MRTLAIMAAAYASAAPVVPLAAASRPGKQQSTTRQAPRAAYSALRRAAFRNGRKPR